MTSSPGGAASISRALASTVPGLPLSEREIDRVHYARDLWPRHHLGVRDGALPTSRPAVIAWPRSTEEVAAIVATCAREGAPIAPFGAGSGVCAGTLPDARTVLLDLKRMNRVRDRSADVLSVEAGALGFRLEEDLNAQGFTLGHFPSSILCSTVGGWIAARSAGQCSGLYGKIEDMVVSLECVVGRGEIVRLARRVEGPDLTPLMIGSEGIYGVITAAELRLHAAPTTRAFTSFSFPTIEAGWESMREMFQAGLRPAVCRLYDAFDSFMARRGAVRGKRHGAPQPRSASSRTIKDLALRLLLRAPTAMNGLVDALGDRALGGAMLVLVFEGEATQFEQSALAGRIAERHQGRHLGEEPARHWLKHRYGVSYRQAPIFMAGAFSDTMEVAAPWSRLGALYNNVREALKDRVFVMAHLSHAYPDGCSIYFTFAGSAKDRASSEELYDATWRDALDAAARAGGTLSHHHGVGRSKAPRLGAELGLGVDLVRSMKAAFDPAGIFNPGNLLPSADDLAVPTRPALEPVADPAPAAPRFDDASLTVHANGKTKLRFLEHLAEARGMTLGLPERELDATIADYLARGAPGSLDPYLDPVDHFVAGFSATTPRGRLDIHPGPRKAVGPDLLALFWGANGRIGTIESAHLRVYRRGLPRADAGGLAVSPAPSIDRQPPLPTVERDLFERVLAAAITAESSS
ncbi:MAG: FAD-linked oxidase C-terminal domain-containing protein [Polyangiaceae bacterium]